MKLEEILKDSKYADIHSSKGFVGVLNTKSDADKFSLSMRVLTNMIVLQRLKEEGIKILPLVREFVDEKIAESLKQPGSGKPACKAACSACCVQIVDCSEEEAAILAEMIPADRLERLEKQSAFIKSGKDFDEFPIALGEQDATCVFLDDNKSCGTYLDRPLICRTVMVENAKACDRYRNTDQESKKMVVVMEAEAMLTAYKNVEKHGTMQGQIHDILEGRK